jgi:hypothetical protein
MWVMLSNSFTEYSLIDFSDVQRISRNYSIVLAFIVDRKFLENQPQGVLW